MWIVKLGIGAVLVLICLDRNTIEAQENNVAQNYEMEKNNVDSEGRDSTEKSNMTRLEIHRPTVAELIQRKIVTECWNPPKVSQGKKYNKVKVHFYLTEAGALNGTPTIVEPDQIQIDSDIALKELADSALEAVKKCTPFDELPSDKYNQWKEIIVHIEAGYQLP